MRLAFISHPARGEATGEPVGRAKRWVAWVLENYPSVVPVAPWITEYEVALPGTTMRNGVAFLRSNEVMRRCDELWLVGGFITSQMTADAESARGVGRHVRDLTALGWDPPRGRTEASEAIIGAPAKPVAAHVYEIEMLGARLHALRTAARLALTPPGRLEMLVAVLAQDDQLDGLPVRSSLVEG